jgi:hypothetical protein
MVYLIARAVLALGFVGAMVTGGGQRHVAQSRTSTHRTGRVEWAPSEVIVPTSAERPTTPTLMRAPQASSREGAYGRWESLTPFASPFARPHDPSHLHDFALLI